MNGERAALAQVDIVEVQLEQLVLAEALFQHDGHDLLEQLAAQRLLGREQRVLDDLLCERAAANEVRPVASEVRDQRADHADGIDARVIVETPVLDGQHRPRHAVGDDRERDETALLAAAVHERRDQRRLERETLATAAPQHVDALDPPPRRFERHAHGVGGGLSAARHERHLVPADRELAGPIHLRPMCVA